MINLPDVTLAAISSIRIEETIQALEKSSENIKFGDVKFITHQIPNYLSDKIEYNYCSYINNIMAFNHLAFSNLGQYVQTKYLLLIQYHGFVINPGSWTDEFLQFDWGGAPWPIVNGAYMANDGSRSRVGNGGFSLRSKKLLDLPNKLGLPLKQEQQQFNEDGNICCYYKAEFLEAGIKYMPVELAAHFSFENIVPENVGVKPFGFHRNTLPWN